MTKRNITNSEITEDFQMTASDVIKEDEYINTCQKGSAHMPRRGIMNRRTFEYLKKLYTRKNESETSEDYETFFPGLKFYHALTGRVDSIRIHKNCQESGPLFFAKNNYEGRGKNYTCLCIYKCPPNPRQVRGLSSVIPPAALIEIARREDKVNLAEPREALARKRPCQAV